MAYWTVPPEWTGETCAILAGGPSLRSFDPRWLHGLRVIVINDSFRLHPAADVLWYADEKWMRRHADGVAAVFRGRYIVTVAHRIPEGLAIQQLRDTGVVGFDPDPGALRTGSNSGYQAIHLAAHFGARRIILLGYDMQAVGPLTHWHAGHGQGRDAYHAVLTTTFLPRFPDLVQPLRERGIEVLNCTPGSALKIWPCRPLDSVLAEERELVA